MNTRTFMIKMKFFYLSKFWICLVPAVVLLTGCKSPGTDKRPNIIIILADDLGYGGLSCYGNDSINTPYLDFLAENGIRFTDFHSNASVCTPTRAALLTGRYQQRSGLEGVIYARGETRQTGLALSELTLAEILKENGYSTGIIGKWHLGYRDQYNPVHQGFDEFYGFRSGNVDYHSHYDNTGVYDWWHNLDSVYEEGYVTDLISSHSIEFVKNHRNDPFFLYVAHEAPHVPFQGRKDPAYRFPDKDFTYYGPVEDRHRAYREMVEVMDESIGELINTLEQLQIDEHTLIFFCSDNGAILPYGDNGPLRGEKGSLWEGGHRVPGIAYWKGKINSSVSDETVLTFDLFPTALSIANIPYPEYKVPDGMDISSLLFNSEELPDRYLFWRYRDQKVSRGGPWKLMIDQSDTLLFNLEQDPGETRNIRDQFPEIAETLLNQLESREMEIDTVNMKTL